MTTGEAAAIQALAASVTNAVEEFRLSMKREVEVSNEVHRDIKELLASYATEQATQRKDINDLKIGYARILGGLALAAFFITVFGVVIWQSVVNQ